MRRAGFLARGNTPTNPNTRRRRRPAAVMALILSAGSGIGTGVLLATPAAATPVSTTWYVATPANGGSDSNNCSQAAPCATISQAVSVAASGDTISVGAGTFMGAAVIPAPLNLSIQGAGDAETTLEYAGGSGTDAVVRVDAGAVASISGVTLSGAGSTFSSFLSTGGELDVNDAIVTAQATIAESTGTLSVTNTTVSAQSGIEEQDGALTASNDSLDFSTISVGTDASGTATGSITDSSCSGGGAFINGGTTTASNLTVTSCQTASSLGTFNISGSTFGGPTGGGIDGFGGDFNISDSSLSGTGGGVYNQAGTTAIDHSTISVNDVDGGGSGAGAGALGPVTTTITNSTLSDTELFGLAGTTSVSDSTVTNTSAHNGEIDGASAPVSLFGDIVDGVFCGGSITDDGYNLAFEDTDTDSCGFTAAQHDVVGQDPQLGPLQDNGGPTFTEAIPPGSPAVHVIPVAQCPTDDQSGVARPQPAGAPSCDIGAVEAQGQAQTVTFSSTPPAQPTVGGSYPVSASASSKLPVTFAIDPSSTAGACTLNGSTVQFTGAGSCVVDATQSGNDTYFSAGAQQTITVGSTGAPSVTGLSPNSGPTSGGTNLTVTGSGFTGATAVLFGGYPGTNLVVVNDTTITVTSPGNSAGVHSVQVQTPSGTSPKVPAGGFNYTGAPSVTGLSPNSGPTSGGTNLTVTGSGFTGATAVLFGGYPGTNIVVVNDTTITVTSPGNSAGVHSVQVSTPQGTSPKVPAGGFTYLGPPTVTGLSPNSGPTSGGTNLTVTGSGFTGATAVLFGGYPGTNVVVVSDTTITVTSPGNSAGVHSVQVSTPGGTSPKVPAGGFTYIGPPTVTGLSPSSGPVTGGTSVTVTGTGFTGATAVLFGGYPGSNVVVVSDTTITVTSPGNTPGVHSVQVSTPSGTSPKVPAGGFTYS